MRKYIIAIILSLATLAYFYTQTAFILFVLFWIMLIPTAFVYWVIIALRSGKEESTKTLMFIPWKHFEIKVKDEI